MSRKKGKIEKNKDITGVIFITLGVWIIVSIFTEFSGILGEVMKKSLFFLLGVGTFILPLLIIFIGICYIARNGKISYNKRFYGLLLFILSSILLIQVVNINKYYDGSAFGNSIKNIYNAESVFHGGLVGYLISIPLYKLLGKVGSYLLLVSGYIISFILFFDFTINDALRKTGLLFGAIYKTTNTKQSRKSDTENFNDSDIVVNSQNGNNDEESFIRDINKKIKIIDFMKSTSIKEEVSVTRESDIPHKLQGKQNETAVKDEISKELTEKIEQSVKEGSIEYTFPDVDLLNNNNLLKMNKDDKKELLSNAGKLEETLGSFGVDAKVVQVTKGPSVTRFELQPNAGVKVSKIVNLADDIALNLASNGVRIEAPIPGKSAVGIEVPNRELTPVFLREVIESDEFSNSKKNLACCLGKDIAGNCVVADLTKMPHVLIAGATGSGKSVCINTLIISLLFKYSPDIVKVLMIDPKVVELNVYNGIPHLLIPVVTDPKKAAGALNWAVNEMTRRYKLFAENGVRNIEGYNDLNTKGKLQERLPWIVIIVDELADLMMVCPNDIEDYIGRLAQMARAAGMHLVIATQRPSVDVITGVIKANIPSRISFAVSSQIDSRTILDCSGAEKLLGKGDMLFYPVGESKPLRIQGAFISEEEVERVITFIKAQQQTETEYKTEILDHINNDISETNEEDVDDLLDEAIKVVVENRQASTSFLQRKLRVGYNRAARIMEQLEEHGIISAKDGSKPREILAEKNAVFQTDDI
jgi:DNA segregation ATPase FtsK/SpoIIIE, S-DNA-T family